MRTRRAVQWSLLFAAYWLATISILAALARGVSPAVGAFIFLGGILVMTIPPVRVYFRSIKGREVMCRANMREAERPLSLAMMAAAIGLLVFSHVLDGALRAVGLNSAVGAVHIAGFITALGAVGFLWIVVRAIPEADEETPAV